MSTGKYLSLPEARKKKDFERFSKEHPSEGDAKLFDKLVKGLTKSPESNARTSGQKRPSED
jgi:hypothetical protein